MMNFFERQTAASHQLVLLISMFIPALILVVLATSLVIAGSLSSYNFNFYPTFITACIIVLLLIIGATIHRILSLSVGGSVFASELGAIPISENCSDFQLMRLRDIVEEIAIASGTQMPTIYVLNTEVGINAFTAGYTSSDAVIIVTRGMLDRLNRDELQAVIAHEYSHILHGDTRLNTRLVGVLYGMMFVGLLGQKWLYKLASKERTQKEYYMLIIGLMMGALTIATGIFVVGYLGLFCSRLIKACINRKREYLSDASAVQYTRQNAGLIGALKKIGSLQTGSTILNINAIEFSHMFFCQTFSPSWGLLATHPPLIDRIKALDPHFSNAELDELRRRWQIQPPNSEEEGKAPGFTDTTTKLSDLPQTINAKPEAIIQKIGTLQAVNYQHASAIINNIPDNIMYAAHNHYAVIPLLYALIYSSDQAVQGQQENILNTTNMDKIVISVKAFRSILDQLNPLLYLPLTSIAWPALRQHSNDELMQFMNIVHQLIQADKQVSIKEYCLGRLLMMQISDFLSPDKDIPNNASIQSATIELSKLMAVLAHVGSDDADTAKQAYLAGMKNALPAVNISYQTVDSLPDALDPVWSVLNALKPDDKKLLLESLIVIVNYDKQITCNEADMLRIVCASLHIPIPMLIEPVGGA
jgi:Zn-dependent protease with chaperone function